MNRIQVSARALCVMAGMLCATAARSQADQVLEEVIVTAQRRPENLFEVPVSITVVSGQTLHDTGARDISAVAGFAPNVSLDGIMMTGGSTATSIYIRGIGQSDMLQTTDPGVGLFIDGVYVARAVGSLLDVADVERVEIMRGPQGTLFGRNTIGGAISVVTRPPGDELAVSAAVTLGSDHRFDSFLRVDAPLSGSARSKLSLASFDQDGYVHRPNVGDSLGDRHRRVAHAQLVYEPGDTLSLAFSGDYTWVDEGGAAATLLRVVQICPNGVSTAFGGCDDAPPVAAPGQTYRFNNNRDINLSAGGAGPGLSIYDGSYVPSQFSLNYGTGPEASTLDLWGLSATLDWQLAAFSLRSITAWRAFDAHLARDTDTSPFRIVLPISTVNQQQFSQELQLFGSNAHLDWLAGLFYLDEEADDDADFITASFQTQGGGQDIINQSAAVFGQASWHFTEKLALTGGARYTDEHKSYVPTQYIVSSVTGQPVPGDVVIPALKNELDDSKSTWRSAFEYTPTEELLLYTSWSTGFKNGGFVQRNQSPRDDLPTFGPETVEVVEIGAKARLRDGRLHLSAAVFSGDYEDIQVRTISGGLAPITSNAGDARIRGGELEVEAVAGAFFRLLGGIGYLDGKYTRLSGFVPGIKLDSKLPDAPEWSGNLSAIGTFPLQGNLLSARIDWRYRSENYNEVENTPELLQDALHLLDASATWRCTGCEGALWSATLGVTNLTDELYLVGGNMLAAQGPIAGSYARLREWFLTIAVDFK